MGNLPGFRLTNFRVPTRRTAAYVNLSRVAISVILVRIAKVFFKFQSTKSRGTRIPMGHVGPTGWPFRGTG